MTTEVLSELRSIYENIDQDDIFQLLNYKQDYIVNVEALIKECEDKPLEMESADSNPLELLKELRDPRFMDPITKQYHQYFDNIKFTYLEQNAKEKFLRNIMNSQFITLEQVDELEKKSVSRKKVLQDNKKRRDDLLEKINDKLRSNYGVYQNIKQLQNECKKSVDKSCDLLRKIEELETENVKYSQQIDKEDEEVLNFVHKFSDFETVINDIKEESLINGRDFSNFDDFVLINSPKNLTALVDNRKRTCGEISERLEDTVKKMKLSEELLQEKTEKFNELISENYKVKQKIEELHERNREILQSAKRNKTENEYERRRLLMSWLHELEKFLHKFDKPILSPALDNTEWSVFYDSDSKKRQVYKLVRHCSKEEDTKPSMQLANTEGIPKTNEGDHVEKHPASGEGSHESMRFKTLHELARSL